MDPKPSQSEKRLKLIYKNSVEEIRVVPRRSLPFGMTCVLIEEWIAVPVMKFSRAKLQEGPEEKAL